MNGKRYYYRLGEKYSSAEFDVICKADGRGRGGNINPSYVKRQELSAIYSKYERVIMDMSDRGKLKSVANIEILLTGQADKRLKVNNPINENFLSVWRDVIATRKASTADSYNNAINCFIESKVYDEADGFAVDTLTVQKWVQYMNNAGYKSSTIGIYLRALRVVFNTCIRKGYLREADYPFSAKDPEKVTIPVGASRKTAVLSISEMTRLYEFFLDGELPSGFRNKEAKNRTLGMFLCQYLCNGCNLYDLALLRYDDYYEVSEHKAFRFFRHKTAEHSEAGSEVIVPITPPLKVILDKIAAPAVFGQLVFPFILGEGMDPESKEAVNKIHQENKNIAKRMKTIAPLVGIKDEPTSTYARHSFATNLSQQGVPLDYVSFAMGHSTGNRGQITKRYISPYPIYKQMEYNSKLLLVKYTENADDSWGEMLSALKEKFGEDCLNAMVAPENAANDRELYQLLSNKFGTEGLNVLKG
jgi:integrase